MNAAWVIGHAWPSFSAEVCFFHGEWAMDFAFRMTDADAEEKHMEIT